MQDVAGQTPPTEFRSSKLPRISGQIGKFKFQRGRTYKGEFESNSEDSGTLPPHKRRAPLCAEFNMKQFKQMAAVMCFSCFVTCSSPLWCCHPRLRQQRAPRTKKGNAAAAAAGTHARSAAEQRGSQTQLQEHRNSTTTAVPSAVLTQQWRPRGGGRAIGCKTTNE